MNTYGLGGRVAVITGGASGDYTDEQWRQVTSVHLDGVFFTQRAAIRAMRQGGRGGLVVNMASTLGAVGFATASAYTAAKHGVVELVAWLASDGASFANGTYYPIDGGYLAR